MMKHMLSQMGEAAGRKAKVAASERSLYNPVPHFFVQRQSWSSSLFFVFVCICNGYSISVI